MFDEQRFYVLHNESHKSGRDLKIRGGESTQWVGSPGAGCYKTDGHRAISNSSPLKRMGALSFRDLAEFQTKLLVEPSKTIAT